MEMLKSILGLTFGMLTLDRLIYYFDNKIFYNSSYYKILKEDLTEKQLQIKNIDRRYIFIHLLTNIFIACYAFSDTLKLFEDPLQGYELGTSSIPIYSVISLHLFHILISLKYLTLIDWIHHLANAFFVSFSSLYYFGNIKVINLNIFFMCGLPGAFDYFFLVLNKYGLIDRLIEKKVNCLQNGYLRMPGILYSTFVGYICYRYLGYEYSLIKKIVKLLILIFSSGNAIFFNNIVQISYGRHKVKN